ncbi:MAG: transglutaminase family protein [Pirellulales bacterium]
MSRVGHRARIGAVLYFIAATMIVGLASRTVYGAERAAEPKPAATMKENAKPGTDVKPAKASVAESIEALVKRTLPSVVIIRGAGRDGRENGLGTGFVVRADGLIATNLHVIGEGRSFHVETSDGRKLTPTAVYASDRHVDLAVVRVDAKDLTPLKLADPSTITPGQEIVVLGNPQGLTHSVVKGVVSGARIIDGMPMVQLAVPIEPGNSGGPTMDRQGRVIGIVTMKSAVTDNLGFAVNVEALQTLLEKPNTVAIDRWLTIGVLDARRWQTQGGAQWRQRAGRIQVSGSGAGIGSRSLCFAVDDAPETFEIAATVKLDEESGAAGLAFLGDGNEQHYGFYPSGGRLRFVRFDGPDVYSWHVLDERPSDAYQPGDWNRLKVHVEAGKARCYVNGKLVFEHAVGEPAGRRVGLVKFRQTTAEFKQFAFGESLPELEPSAELLAAFNKLCADLPQRDTEIDLPQPLTSEAAAGVELLRTRAKALEREAEQLREVAASLHRRSVVDALAKEFAGDEAKVDLLRSALLIARLDNDELDVEAYRDEVGRMADEIRRKLPAKADDQAKLAALNAYLYEDNGYHGSRRDYDSLSNSYLNEVIDDREGLPITLSVLHIEVARRLGLKMEGIGMPGHFLAAYVGGDGQRQLLDPFEEGAKLTEAEALARAFEITGRRIGDEALKPVTKKAIVLRILENLLKPLGRAAARRTDARLLGSDPDVRARQFGTPHDAGHGSLPPPRTHRGAGRRQLSARSPP